MIAFRVNGLPKGQPRPRAFSRGGRAGMYDPGTAEGWKALVAYAAKPHMPSEPLNGPLQVTIDLYFPRPKSHFLKSGLRQNAPIYVTSKPDTDNLAKAILDALTNVRLWGDDAQVAVLQVGKSFSNNPGAMIEVKPLITTGLVREGM